MPTQNVGTKRRAFLEDAATQNGGYPRMATDQCWSRSVVGSGPARDRTE